MPRWVRAKAESRRESAIRGSWLTVGPKAPAEWVNAVKARANQGTRESLMGRLVGFTRARFRFRVRYPSQSFARREWQRGPRADGFPPAPAGSRISAPCP